jgi:hypothetical protein
MMDTALVDSHWKREKQGLRLKMAIFWVVALCSLVEVY